MKCSLVSLFFLKRSLVFPILLFSSISLHWLLRKAFLSLIVILWNSEFKWVYLSFSPLPLAPLLFSAIWKASSCNHFAFLHFFFLGMVLLPVSCTMSWTSIHSSSGALSYLIPWIYLSLPLYNRIKKRKKKVKSLSHVWLFATPWTVAYQSPPSMGFSRQEYWNGLPFPSPGDLPDPGIETESPAL